MGGIRLIDRVAAAIRPVVDDLLLVANQPDASAWLADARVVRDVYPTRASLVGIHAALSHAPGDVVVLGWDMPFVPTALLRFLAAQREGVVQAVVPDGPGGPEPCAAVYTQAALPIIVALIEAGTFRVSALVDTLARVERVGVDVVARFGDPARIFTNVNTPAQLATLTGDGDRG